jgi:nitrate reductase / nitrite oxidoreductase, alpha subunit
MPKLIVVERDYPNVAAKWSALGPLVEQLCQVQNACEAILGLSGTTNGRLATEGFRTLERATGLELADLSASREADRITFHDTQVHPTNSTRTGSTPSSTTSCKPFV